MHHPSPRSVLHAPSAPAPPPSPAWRPIARSIAGPLRSFALLLVALLLPACGLTANQQAAVAKFSAASSTLGDLASDEFIQSRNDVIAMNTAALQLGERTVDPDKLDQFVTLERVQFRTAACDALRTYGDLLQTLATSDNSAELQAAADSFTASLKTVKALRLKDEQAGTVSEAIQFLASGIIEAERAKRVRSIVKQSSPAVRAVADLLRDDFDLTGEFWQLAFDASASRLRKAASESTESAIDKQSFVALRSTSLARRDAAVAEIASAVDALTAAEKELSLVVDYPEVSLGDIAMYYARVERLVSIIRILAKP